MSTVFSSRRRGPDCASDLALDQLACGEADGAERTRLTGHLAICETCTAAQTALAADHGQFLAEVNVASLAADAMTRAERARPTWISRLLVPVGLAAAVAASMVFWQKSDENRTKGGFALRAFVLHVEKGGTVGEPHFGELLHPGDKLEFRYRGDRGFLAVVAMDATKTVSVYWPPGPMTRAVPGDREFALTTAVELDETLGEETLMAVTCPTPTPVSEIVKAVERQAQSGEALDIPCAVSRQTIQKVPRP